MPGLLSGLRNALGSTNDDQADDEDEKPCRVSGHNRPESVWKLYGYFARTGGFSRRTFTVRKKELGNCTKCGSTESRKTVIGKIHVTEDDELEVR